jgi:hypothetical protein
VRCAHARLRTETHEIRQFAVSKLKQHRDLVVLDLECHGDYVVAVSVVAEPDGNCMKSWQLPDSD